MASKRTSGDGSEILRDLLETLATFSATEDLTNRVSALERDLASKTRDEVSKKLEREGINLRVLDAALTLKGLVSRVNDIVHATGILVCLPYVLGSGEVVERLSLAAGNTGRRYDLETDRQIAEFKFIRWRGRDAVRQNGLFVDLFNLASAETTKKRVIYLVSKDRPVRFLNGRRALNSILSRDATAAAKFRDLHGHTFSTVGEYYATVQHIVEIVDLVDLVPELRPLTQ